MSVTCRAIFWDRHAVYIYLTHIANNLGHKLSDDSLGWADSPAIACHNSATLDSYYYVSDTVIHVT